MDRGEELGYRHTLLFGSICAVAVIAAIVLVVYGIWRHAILPLRGAYLIVLLALFAISFTLFLNAIFLGKRITFESNWGGLGGGLGGWRISSPLTFLLLSIGILALLVAAVSAYGPAVTTIADDGHPNLMERYRAAINFGVQNGIRFESSSGVIGDRLVLKGTAPSQPVADAFWNQLTLANPLHNDVVAQITIKPAVSPAGAKPGP